MSILPSSIPTTRYERTDIQRSARIRLYIADPPPRYFRMPLFVPLAISLAFAFRILLSYWEVWPGWIGWDDKRNHTGGEHGRRLEFEVPGLV